MNKENQIRDKRTPQSKKHKPFQLITQIIQSSQNKKHNLKVKKPSLLQLIQQNFSIISQYKFLIFHKTIQSNLLKYNITKEAYEIKIINDIIFDESKHIVSIFKNNLVWDESSDFLKRFYNEIESLIRLPKISSYYQEYTLFVPIYFKLDCCRLMMKNTKKKKKVLEMEEEKDIDKRKVIYKDMADNRETISYFIKPEEVDIDLAKSQSQSQLSYLIRNIDESDQFIHRINCYKENENSNGIGNGNTKEIDISLTQYQDNSETNKMNLIDIINDSSIKNSRINIHDDKKKRNNINVKQQVVNIKQFSKAKTNVEINTLNFESVFKNARQGLIPHFKSITQRMTPSKNSNKQELNKRMSKPQTIPSNMQMPVPNHANFKTIDYDSNTNCNGQTSIKKNICLNVFQLINVPKANIESHSNRNESESQMKYRKLVLDMNNKANQSDKSPNNVNNKNRNLVLSNDNSIRKNTKRFVKLKSNMKATKPPTSNHNKINMEKYLTKPLILDHDKKKITQWSNAIPSHSNSITPTGYLLSKSNRNTISSSNTQATNSNIKITVTNPPKSKTRTSLTKQITPSLTTRDRHIELTHLNKKTKAFIPQCYYKQIKLNGQSKMTRENQKEGQNNQKYSRNSKTLLQTNFQSSSIKRKANLNNGLLQPKQPTILLNTNNTINNHSSQTTKNVTITINKSTPRNSNINKEYTSTNRNQNRTTLANNGEITDINKTNC